MQHAPVKSDVSCNRVRLIVQKDFDTHLQIKTEFDIMLKSNQFYKKGTSKKYWYMANDKKYVN